MRGEEGEAQRDVTLQLHSLRLLSWSSLLVGSSPCKFAASARLKKSLQRCLFFLKSFIIYKKRRTNDNDNN